VKAASLLRDQGCTRKARAQERRTVLLDMRKTSIGTGGSIEDIFGDICRMVRFEGHKVLRHTASPSLLGSRREQSSSVWLRGDVPRYQRAVDVNRVVSITVAIVQLFECCIAAIRVHQRKMSRAQSDSGHSLGQCSFLNEHLPKITRALRRRGAKAPLRLKRWKTRDGHWGG
jgi:hypothetical protein